MRNIHLPPITPEVQADDVEKAVPTTLRSATKSPGVAVNGLGPAERIVAAALASAGPQAMAQLKL